MSATTLSPTAFNELAVDAGIILSSYTPGNDPDRTKILCATTGGITINCKPNFSDWGEDVDNCPNGMMEFKNLDDFEVTVTTTAITIDNDFAQWLLGAADISSGKVVPRRRLQLTDYKDLYFVCDKSDGGYVWAKISNALSTGGLSFKTTKNEKGNLDVEFMGHYSLEDPDEVPFEIGVIDGTSGTTGTTGTT